MNDTQKTKEEVNRLQVDEVQASRYVLPMLIISDDDKTKYAQSLATGVPFFEAFEYGDIGLKIVLRDKTKRETDIVSRQIDFHYNKGTVLSAGEYTSLFNLGCLYYQLEEVNGVKQTREYPKSTWDMGDFNILDCIDKSSFGESSSTYSYVLVCIMAQFNNKLLDLAKGVFDPNFSWPAKGS